MASHGSPISPAIRTGGASLLTISIGLLLAVGIAVAAYRYPPPSLPFVLAGGTGLLGLTFLAIARYDWAVALGIGLLGVVNVEPAPPDLVFAVVIAVAATTGRFDLDRVPLVIFAAIGSFVFLNLTSMIEAIDPWRAAMYFSITLYLAIFALWMTSYLRSERRARIVLIAYLTAAGLSAFLALGALLAGFPGADQLVYAETRARGLFKDANVFGPFLIPAVLLLLQETIKPRLLRLNLLFKLALIFLLTLGVVFSFSRAAWLNLGIGLIVTIGVLLIQRTPGPRMVIVVGLLALVGFGVGGLVIATGSDQFLNQRASLQGYDAERFGAQEAGIQTAEEHPLGAGPGQFEVVINYSAHSLYVRSFAEQGVLGLAVLVLMIGATLLMAARNALFDRSAYGLGSAALLGAWVGLIINSFFVDTLHWRHLWLVAALIWVAAMRPRAEERPGPPSEPAPPARRAIGAGAA